MEQEHLALNGQHIALGREIVARQRKLVADLEAQGRDTADAETTLRLFVKTLGAFEDHRRKILAAIASGRK